MNDLAQSPAWRALEAHRKTATAISSDPARLDDCCIACGGLSFNYALTSATPETIALLVKLAEQQDLAGWRMKLFSGEKINVSEGRAALHAALRQQDEKPAKVDGRDVIPEVRATRKQLSSFAADVRHGHWKGATGKPVKHVVNIGIGGSDLGPRLAVQALDRFADGPRAHFVANADAFELLNTLKPFDPAETLFIVVSKTFTTQETLLNAQTARKWLVEKLGEKAVNRHFVAVSAAVDDAKKFGIETVFPMWDWVGGRTSVWSAVGLALEVAIGTQNFEKLLAGAAAMDRHFLTSPLDKNMPVVMGLLGVWHRDFCNMPALAILPYSERLRDLPRYLQQLEMESNGKSVTRDAVRASYPTAPAIFGESGTVGQHSFYQWLHQGTTPIAADFIGVVEDDLGEPAHHQALMSNMAAQAGALAFGKQSSSPHDSYEGGRPSNLILLEKLNPQNFGALLALYEHKVFVQSVIWNLNPFDQPGVELGKKIAKGLEKGDLPEGSTAAFYKKLFGLLVPHTKKS